MKNKRFLLLLSILLVASLLLSGCPFRRPVPERQPVPGQPPQQQPAPAPAPAPENRQDPQQIPRPGEPAPRVQPGQPGPDGADLAERVSDLATDVEGVDRSVVVVISNMALVGITIERDQAAQRNENEIKQEVSRVIEERERSIVNAYVSANPDIVRQLDEISRGVQRGEPISTFFDQITEVLQRMRAETN